MIEVIHTASIRKADKPDVVMARMDYVIIYQVIKRLNEIGMTDDELSFLLGKSNNYVFGFIVKPSDKKRFNEDQLDLLPFILNCSSTDIIPDGTPAGDIQLYHTKANDDDDYKGFLHIIYSPDGKGTRIIWKKKKAQDGSYRRTNPILLEQLEDWITEGYFANQADALQLYNKLRAETTLSFSISELEKCMKVLCSNRKNLLHKKSIAGVLKYWSKTNAVRT